MVRHIGTPNISIDTISKILELNKTRLSYNAIGKELGISKTTVMRYVKRYS